MNRTRESSRHSEIAIRMLSISVIGLFLLLIRPGDAPLLGLCALAALTIDIRNPMSMKNFFLVYTFLLFGVGADILQLTRVSVVHDAIFYVGAFLIGYEALSLSQPGHARSHQVIDHDATPSTRLLGLRHSSIMHAMAVLVGLNFVLLLFDFSRYGVVGYYQGQQLIDQFLTFGKANPASGAEQIIRFGLTYTALAIVVIYSQERIEAARRIRYRYPVGLLIVLPILFLRRADAFVGAVTIVGIYACELRVSSVSRSRDARNRSARDRPRTRVRGSLVGLGILMAFGAALLIGGLRGGVGTPAGTPTASVGTKGLLIEEFTPIEAYGDIKANARLLGHPHGRTIVLPLIFKVIPRAWLPSKPLNSGAYYMSVVHPAEYAAGLGLPPTFFGDALLSFGFIGALAMCFVLGGFVARLDLGYKEARRSRIPIFLIVFANFYGLMRSPISESLAGIALTMLVWGAANHVYRTRPLASSTPVDNTRQYLR